MVKAIKDAHRDIKEDFASDQGVFMMRKDSDILISVMLQLVNLGIPFLPVHDFIICPAKDVNEVIRIMEESFLQAFPGIPCRAKQ